MGPRVNYIVQIDGSPVHIQPGSTPQAAEQPSPSAVPPSSQASAPARMPSPQVVVQTDGSPLQLKPGSTMQTPEQPSPFARLPSSQSFVASTTPLPQLARSASNTATTKASIAASIGGPSPVTRQRPLLSHFAKVAENLASALRKQLGSRSV